MTEQQNSILNGTDDGQIEADVSWLGTEEQSFERISRQIAEELQKPLSRVQAVIRLLDEGNTIPFIARYRKEISGEMDENVLRALEERLNYLRNLEERKAEVLQRIHELGKLTPDLLQAIQNASKLQEVEDYYRPYRQKRRTRASVAKERGLEPLAQWIEALPNSGNLHEEAAQYVNAELEVEDVEVAIAGALDILAEQISDDPEIRVWIRNFTRDHGVLRVEAKDGQKQSVYEMYYDYEEPVRKIPPHRVLAINRGEREEFLRVALQVPEERILDYLNRKYNRAPSVVAEQMTMMLEDSYKRLIAPSVEREIRNELTEKAEEHAIDIFAQNLRNLLLQPPVKGRTVLGVDPAYRTGCKLAVVDETGKLLEVAVAYPTPPHEKLEEAYQIFKNLIERYNVTLIAIGNGTASRETEFFVADFIRKTGRNDLQYIIVNEAGASVYSASKLAQDEFPDLDVSERSAVSIARRLQDPLSELVKIDPKAIGVGQYQHDVSQKHLGESLKAVVESVVNHVGVDLNTASASLLSYVSGINQTTARNIVHYRNEHGRFVNREQLKNVPRLGAKTFEQCAGFLRVSEGDQPLDNTAIHPESYAAVQQLLHEIELDLDAIGSEILKNKLQTVDRKQLAEKTQLGLPTLIDIIDSLQRPGRDPRDELPPPLFHTDVLQIEDLRPGMELMGTVRNVLDFGAFVDIGIENDGLVHISQLSDQYVKHPMDVVSVGDNVKVWVLSVDVAKKRVGLTMRKSSIADAISSNELVSE